MLYILSDDGPDLAKKNRSKRFSITCFCIPWKIKNKIDIEIIDRCVCTDLDLKRNSLIYAPQYCLYFNQAIRTRRLFIFHH